MPPGEHIYFRWCFTQDDSGTSSQALGIDAMLFQFTAEPIPDLQAPVATMQTPSPEVAAAGPVNIQVDYTDDIAIQAITLVPGDVTLHRTGTANATVEVNGSGTFNRTITLSNITRRRCTVGFNSDWYCHRHLRQTGHRRGVWYHHCRQHSPDQFDHRSLSTLVGGMFNHDVAYYYTFDDATTLTSGFVWDEIVTTGTVDAAAVGARLRERCICAKSDIGR